MNILVTGASRGIGRAIAEALKDVHKVFVMARTEELLQGFSGCCVADLATIEGMEKVGQFIQENKIDVLINNAGEYLYTPILKGFSFDKLEHILKLNLEAPLY